MTKLLQRLHDELVRRHYATTTRESYLRILNAFQRMRIGALRRAVRITTRCSRRDAPTSVSSGGIAADSVEMTK